MNNSYHKIIKPILDYSISITLLIILSPILALSILLLYISNKGNVFFIQTRPGINEKPFKLIKFKTMNDERDERGRLLPDEQRLTEVGNIIRKLSIDELLQLINILKGEMSLIGPRPLLMEYLPLYNNFQKRRHNVKPGITGWAQVNGRNAISWEEKFMLDVWYVDNICFMLDLKIFFITIINIIKRKNISSSTSVTMERFLGTQIKSRDFNESNN